MAGRWPQYSPYQEKRGNRMPSGGRHLTRHDRCRIQARGKAGHRRGDRPLAAHREPWVGPELRPARPSRGPAAGGVDGPSGCRRRTGGLWRGISVSGGSPAQTPKRLASGGRARVSATWIARTCGPTGRREAHPPGSRRASGPGGHIGASRDHGGKVRVGDREVDTIMGARTGWAIVSLVNPAMKFKFFNCLTARLPRPAAR